MVRTISAIALAAFCVVLAQESPRAWGAPQSLCTLDDRQVDESSGVAASGLTAGVFFTHNDSGDKPRFFRFKKDGKVDGEYSLKGAQAVDWEDMARAMVDGKSFLYFGDFGDNAEHRKSVTIYRAEEPTQTGSVELTKFDTYTVTYPDGAHNCEALFVRSNGDIWVVTKNPGGNSEVFALAKPKATGSYSFEKVANLAIDTGGIGGKYVTGADISPDGKFVVVRTYSAALEFRVPQKFEDWVKASPTPIRTALEVQGEAIAYAKDGLSLVTTSEHAPCPVSLMPLSKN
jgi:hypothetical protein